MRYHTVLALAAAATMLGSTAVGAQESTGKRFHVSLDGASEVPGPGDPNGSGTATIRINVGQQQLCYTLKVSDIQPASAAHIHEAPAGQAGPVVVDLRFSGAMGQRCVQIDRRLAQEIIRNPDDYYINVHNMEYPSGAVRGQLSQ